MSYHRIKFGLLSSCGASLTLFVLSAFFYVLLMGAPWLCQRDHDPVHSVMGAFVVSCSITVATCLFVLALFTRLWWSWGRSINSHLASSPCPRSFSVFFSCHQSHPPYCIEETPCILFTFSSHSCGLIALHSQGLLSLDQVVILVTVLDFTLVLFVTLFSSVSH